MGVSRSKFNVSLGLEFYLDWQNLSLSSLNCISRQKITCHRCVPFVASLLCWSFNAFLYKLQEMTRGLKYGKKTDLWSLGVLFYEIWTWRWAILEMTESKRRLTTSFSTACFTGLMAFHSRNPLPLCFPSLWAMICLRCWRYFFK